MRILVVEDEPAAASVLAKGLREHAYAVDIALDGRAALEQIADTDYDTWPHLERPVVNGDQSLSNHRERGWIGVAGVRAQPGEGEN